MCKTEKLKKGMVFKCTKDFYMEDGELDYIKGKKYLCEIDGCLTDEQGCETHQFCIGYSETLLEQHFKRIK